MQFKKTLIPGMLVKRYQRFLADIQLADGTIVTAHTANTGAMTGCACPGARVWVSESDNPKRKYPYTWELVQVAGQTLVGINTARSNVLVKEAIINGVIHELKQYKEIRTEVRYGEQNSRIDLLLQQHPSKPDCYVEVKNVTLAKRSMALFPDAVSRRAKKHAQELASMRLLGYRAVMIFCIQRNDVSEMATARDIDPSYCDAVQQAADSGVEILAYTATVSPQAIRLSHPLSVTLR